MEPISTQVGILAGAPALWLWANYLTSLYLSSFIYKVGLITIPPSYGGHYLCAIASGVWNNLVSAIWECITTQFFLIHFPVLLSHLTIEKWAASGNTGTKVFPLSSLLLCSNSFLLFSEYLRLNIHIFSALRLTHSCVLATIPCSVQKPPFVSPSVQGEPFCLPLLYIFLGNLEIPVSLLSPISACCAFGV